MKTQVRPLDKSISESLMMQGIDPLLAPFYASRGITSASELDYTLDNLIKPESLLNALEAAEILYDYIKKQKKIIIVADYDADGATACAIGYRGLKRFGANVGYMVPNRLVHGYGLTPMIVDELIEVKGKPDLIVTVDNGIASHAGIDRAKKQGIPVLVTDHHLAAETLPNALCIVNPNQPADTFPSKALAGCGVMFYVIWALRNLMCKKINAPVTQFSLKDLLPIVAVGTIADVVKLDYNNRILVHVGLSLLRMHNGDTKKTLIPGIEALATLRSKKLHLIETSDIGFGIGPRINAAGRLESMSRGIELLISNNMEDCERIAKELNSYNDSRKNIEGSILEAALAQVSSMARDHSIVLHEQEWHQGVIGIVAGRIKEQFHKPTIVMATDGDFLKGSARSIEGLHIRDALDVVYKKNPSLITKFGGHSMAAGLSIPISGLDKFRQEFEKASSYLMEEGALDKVFITDGELDPEKHTPAFANIINRPVWGQGFPPPLFEGRFKIIEKSFHLDKETGEAKHTKWLLDVGGNKVEAVQWKKVNESDSPKLRCVYKLGVNVFGGVKPQMIVDAAED